ncbi:hypothetical protein [Mesorhizobium sp. BH1-1-4]|uniref:hypothetical protein n=1 Tax=Mesorhizobium sp. BH1-1-4 TaxID=2876662 RepID=UPI001CD04EBF|nr:hypothetical protein [Mesorhizobium sp. BH1-1-4]MBZ9993130.1 hypothetical protein [Mesorhizobium sp. BH1-1-4]
MKCAGAVWSGSLRRSTWDILGFFLRVRFPIVVASLFIASASVAADALQPLADEPVAQHISGYGEIYVGGLRIEEGAPDGTTDTGAAAARVNIPFANLWNLQGDLSYERIWQDSYNFNGRGAALHAYYRDATFAAGAFAIYKSTAYDGENEGHQYLIGPEAQVYLGNLTLYGQAWFGRFENDFAHEKQWGGRAVARYFIQKNLRVDGEFSFEATDIGVPYDVLAASVEAMYCFEDTPWSIFGRYQFEHYKIDSFDAGNGSKFVVGLHASFGSNSLFDEDRAGATMDTHQANSILSFTAVQ